MASSVTRDHHNLRRNLKLNDNYVSNDGGDEGIRITDAGLVGIGVSDPDTMLEVYKVGTQLKLSGGAVDYATFAVAADGALTITTEDASASEGDIILVPNGLSATAVFSSTGMALNSVGETTISLSSGSSSIRLFSLLDTDNYVTFTGTTNGALSIITHDDVGNEADINITADGYVSLQSTSGENITLNSDGDIILDADGDNITMLAGGTGSGLDFIQSGTGDYTIKNLTSDKDTIFNVNDGGVDTEVMRVIGATKSVLIASGSKLTFADSGESIIGDGTDLTIASGNDLSITSGADVLIDATGDIKLNADGGDISLTSGDGLAIFAPTASGHATTKVYVDRQTVITGNVYNSRVDATTWYIMNNDTAQPLGGTDTTVGDQQDIGIVTRFDHQCLMAIIPYDMTVHAISGGVSDDDMDTTTEKRIGLWRLPSFSTSGADPGNSNADTFRLAYITDGFGGAAGKFQGFHDTSADFALSAGDGIFMGYLNPQSGGNDDVTLTMSIWAHKT